MSGKKTPKPTPRPIQTKFFEFDNTPPTSTTTPGVWNGRHEIILKIWGEEAACWKKMHEMAHSKYEFLNMKLTLPVIIMSTLTGTANFAMSSFSEPWKSHVSIIIGSVNLLAGMVTTISQYLRVNESSEGHRVAALAYGKLTRIVTSELTLAPDERSSDGLSLVRKCRAEMDRLEEQGPDVSDDIIDKFLHVHGENISNQNIYLPSNINLRSVVIYQPDNKDLEYRVTTPDSALSARRRVSSLVAKQRVFMQRKGGGSIEIMMGREEEKKEDEDEVVGDNNV